MPLYACNRCGFTSAAFRVDAARTHRLEYPECEGSIQIIFRSDDRSRGMTLSPRRATAHATASTDPQRPPAAERRRAFEMRERLDADATLRLIVCGELDTAVTDRLTERLHELHATGHPVRLDLSQLAFIDSSGVQALLLALTDARSEGWQLEVAREVSPSVQRAGQIMGIRRVLWPDCPAPAALTSQPETPLH
jgi:anti-anti-sigma factor